MRLILILLIAVAMATSGCFGKDDDGGDGTPTVTTPAGNTTTTTPTGTTPGGTNNTNTTPTTPAKPAPKDVCSVGFEYTDNIQAGAPPTHVTAADCGTVAAGYTKLTLNVTFNAAGGAPVIAADGISVAVLDSAGTAVVTCTGPSAGPAAATVCSQEANAAPGAYTLVYNGQGNVGVSGAVTAS